VADQADLAVLFEDESLVLDPDAAEEESVLVSLFDSVLAVDEDVSLDDDVPADDEDLEEERLSVL
jgi:hypothetical protein